MNKNELEGQDPVEINGSKVMMENGEVKIVYSEEIEKTGYMSVEEARAIGHAVIRLQYSIK